MCRNYKSFLEPNFYPHFGNKKLVQIFKHSIYFETKDGSISNIPVKFQHNAYMLKTKQRKPMNKQRSNDFDIHTYWFERFKFQNKSSKQVFVRHCLPSHPQSFGGRKQKRIYRCPGSPGDDRANIARIVPIPYGEYVRVHLKIGYVDVYLVSRGRCDKPQTGNGARIAGIAWGREDVCVVKVEFDERITAVN